MSGAKWDERDVATALKRYHSRLNGNGNGPRYVFARQVRNRAGFNATRTFDAVAVDLWPSAGLRITQMTTAQQHTS